MTTTKAARVWDKMETLERMWRDKLGELSVNSLAIATARRNGLAEDERFKLAETQNRLQQEADAFAYALDLARNNPL